MAPKTVLSPTNAAIKNDIKVLRNIHLKHKNIAIYRRNIDDWEVELEHLLTSSFECRVSGTMKEIASSLQTYFADNFPSHDFLLEDISELVEQFSQITKVTSFRVLLATIDTNMCRKFHADINSLRMLCTYVGPGTLWLPDTAVNSDSHKIKDKNQSMEVNEDSAQQVNSGDVIILKGALYPEANAVLHRSPIIEKTGEKRLLLRVDTNETLNFWT